MPPESRFATASAPWLIEKSSVVQPEMANESVSIKIAAANPLGNPRDIAGKRAVLRKRRRDFSHSSECALDPDASF